MAKTKNKGTRNSKAVAQQAIKKKGSGTIQKNKNPKLKNISGYATLLNKFETQNEDKLFQKTTGTKSSQNLLQNNEKELKAEQYSLIEKKNILNKLQNKPAIKKMTLNFDRMHFKEKLEVNFDSVINERTILLDSLKGRDGSYEEEELDLIISDIEKSLACKDYDDKDDVSNDVEARNIVRTIVRANDTMIEIKHDDVNGSFIFLYNGKGRAPYSRTAVRVDYDVRKINTTHQAEIREIFEKFGSIEKINFKSNVAIRFGKNRRLLQRISDHKLDTITALIHYHSPISAKRAFSMNGQWFGESYITVRYYDSDIPHFLLDDRKCVYLSNLSRDIDNNTIWKLFSTYGEIEFVYLSRHDESGICRGFGWVVFMTEDAVRKAVELNGTLVLDCQIIVKDYSTGFFGVQKITKFEKKKTTKIDKFLAKDKEKHNLPHKSNNNNSSKKLKIIRKEQ